MLSLLGSLRRGNFVTNSLRFRSSVSAYLSKTFGGAGNTTTSTWSGWVKRGSLTTPASIVFWAAGTSVGNNAALFFNVNDQLSVSQNLIGNNTIYRTSNAVYRDPSAWYHIVFVLDTNNPADQNRARIWVNGVEITSWATNTTIPSGTTFWWNANTAGHAIGSNFNGTPSQYFDGYLTEVHFIDGQALTPSSFGQIESTTGVWSPKQYVGTYGTNGFYLKFNNTSSAAALGNDSSGNVVPNNWTVNNVSLTPGVTYDSMFDVPVNYSDSGNGRGNYAVLNPLDPTFQISGSANLSNGNLRVTGVSLTDKRTPATIRIPSGKFYIEATLGSAPTSNQSSLAFYPSASPTYYAFFNGQIYVNSVLTTTVAAPVNGDVIGYAVDRDASTIAFYRNNTLLYTASGVAAGEITPAVFTGTNDIIDVNFGQRPFINTTVWATLQAAGFRTLNTNNLPTPSIVNGANFMAATAYTGNATARSLSNVVNGVSFQPDLVWIKNRTATTNHALFDSTRGVTKYLSSNTAAVEGTLAQGLTAFNANGFSLGTDTTLVNSSTGGANSYIAWQWKESITAGLDVVSYTGNNISGTAISHNLGVIPSFVIIKSINNSTRWLVKGPGVTGTNVLSLNETTELTAGSNGFIGTLTSSVIQISGINTNSDINALGATYVAYCFAEIAGFSKFGNYVGNANVNGPFVFCGFKPKFVMYKSISGGANSNWQIFDSTRDVYNVVDEAAAANVTPVVSLGAYIDILSNGFKLRTNSNAHNGSGVTFVFAAFAEVPSKYALAR